MATPVARGREARRRAGRRLRGQRSFDRLGARGDLRPAESGRVMVALVSTFIHVLSAAIPVGSILLVWQVHLWWAWPLAVLGLGIWLFVRPRLRPYLRRPDRNAPALTRETAPHLFALLDRCAETLGAPRVDKVLLTGDFAAGTARLTTRRTVHLFLGIPLWTAAPRRARLALLGHQLAHQANGDVSTGWWAKTARQSLLSWIRLSDPRGLFTLEVNPSRRIRPWNGPDPLNARIHVPNELGYQVERSRIAPSLAMMLATRVSSVLIFGPFWVLAHWLSRALARLDLRCHEPAEYFADEAGARLGSTEAALTLLDTLALREPAQRFLGRPTAKASEMNTSAVWEGLREHLASVPEHERRRLIRLQELEGTGSEDGHPPDHLRRALLAARPQRPAELIVHEAEWDAIDAELKPRIEKATRDVLAEARS